MSRTGIVAYVCQACAASGDARFLGLQTKPHFDTPVVCQAFRFPQFVRVLDDYGLKKLFH